MSNAPRVLNMHDTADSDGSVYVGRPTIWGNPFLIPRDGSREQVIEKFRQYLMADKALQEAVRRELRGKNLVCWCAPRRCHADVLLEFANAP